MEGRIMTTREPDRPTFVIRLRPEPQVDDAVIALRRGLKALLRQFGLRAISAVREPADKIAEDRS
jgi:hypothetical protein